jgi:hypothetical protein
MNLLSKNDSQLDGGSLRELAALGQLRGALTVDEIRHALPVDRMSDEDMTLAVAYLEERGIDIVVEPSLLRGPALVRQPSALDRTIGVEPPRTIAKTTELDQQPAHGEAAQAATPADVGRSVSPTLCVLLAAIVVGILAAILFSTVW